VNLTNLPAISERRHADPPVLWGAVFLSSVVIHLSLFWLLRPSLLGRAPTNQATTAPIPIDLIITQAPKTASSPPQRVSATSAPASRQAPSTSQPKTTRTTVQPSQPAVPRQPTGVVSPPPQPQTPTRTERPRIAPTPAPALSTRPDAVQPSPARTPGEGRLAQPLPSLSPSRPSPFWRTPEPSPAAQPLPSQTAPLPPRQAIVRSPAAPASPIRQSTPSPSPARQEPVRSPAAPASPIRQATPSPSPARQEPVRSPAPPASPPPTPPQSQPSPTREPAPPAPPASPPPTPPQSEPSPSPAPLPAPQIAQGILTTVSNYRLANADKDIPDVLPEPQQREKLISGVTYPLPQAGDSSVVLQVDLLLDDTGKAEVQSTQVLKGNPTISPDQLAQTILQNWEFTPAYQAGQPVYSLLRVEFRIVPQAN
jgi:hypothetical protein